MKYVQCKKCDKVYPGSLKRCPECKTKTPPSKSRIVMGVVIGIIGLALLFSVATNWNDTGAPKEPTSQNQQDNNELTQTKSGVTYENFEKIQTGMTYEQVVEIFGKEGKVMSEVDMGMEEYATKMYYWYDNTGIANCNVTIQGGKVIAKAQAGLR